MSDDHYIKTKLKQALGLYSDHEEYRMRPDKAKVDNMRRRHGVTGSGSTSAPKDLSKDDSGVDLGYDKIMNDGTQNDDDEVTEAEGRCVHEEMAAEHAANDEEEEDDDAGGDEEPALPDYEAPDLGESWSGDHGPGDIHLGHGSLLLNMPREILAQSVQILKSAMKVDGSLSDHEFHFKCPTRACSQKPVKDQETPIVQYLQVREVLKTCKQIRNEAEQVFFKINEWTLHRARLRKGGGLNSKILAEDTQRMFKRYIPCDHTEQKKCSRSRLPHVRYFRNFNMQIAISPTATVDLPLPDGVDPCDAIEVEHVLMSEDQAVVRRHTLTEAEQCEMYGAALSGFVKNQGGIFQDLRLLSLEIALHSPARRARGSPLNRCGTTFRVRILLDASTKVDYITHPEPPTMFDELNPDLQNLDPRRRMLAPLLELRGVRTVEVHRRWSLRYKVVKNEVENYIADHALGQYVRYDSISRFLDKAGPHFANLLNTGLEHFKIPTKDLIRIFEDDGGGHDTYDLVPPAENGEQLGNSEIQH